MFRVTPAIAITAITLTFGAISAPAAAPMQAAASALPAPTREGATPAVGGAVRYQVFGDLSSGVTPLMILHGSYMSGDGMWPIAQPFVADRPVILVDQRGHGRTGDLPGPITYDMLADDAAAVLDALGLRTADVLGYSMGGNAAIVMAVRHPDRVGKLISLAATYSKSGWYPQVQAAFGQTTPELFAGGPLEAEYKRLSPTPEAFATLVEELRTLDVSTPDVPEAAVGAIGARTMVIIGDADGVTLDHAVRMFQLRGGGDVDTAMRGFMTEAPRARLAILPAMTHVGLMGEGELLHALVTPFLNDTISPTPPGFF